MINIKIVFCFYLLRWVSSFVRSGWFRRCPAIQLAAIRQNCVAFSATMFLGIFIFKSIYSSCVPRNTKNTEDVYSVQKQPLHEMYQNSPKLNKVSWSTQHQAILNSRGPWSHSKLPESWAAWACPLAILW